MFKGWYRKSFSRKSNVWHRVYQVNSILNNQQIATTVCRRHISTTHCDFDMNPDNKCMYCEKPPGVIIEMYHEFAPIGSTGINTKADAIHELRRLLKPRIYYVKIWEDEGVCITAKWESDVSISIYTKHEIIINKRKNRVIELAQAQADLGRFKSAIDCLCNASDVLALAAKRKKKLKGKLTEVESCAYFEELMCEAEK